MLLSNLSASSIACSTIISMKVNVITTPKVKNNFYPTQSRCGSCPAPVPYPEGETTDELALPLLLDAYVQGAGEDPQVRKGSLHFLSSVFANVASSSTGRNFFYTPRPSSFQEPIRGSGTFASSSRIRDMPRYRLSRRVPSCRPSLKVEDRGSPFMTYSRSRHPRSGRPSSRSWRKNGDRVSPCSHVQQRRPCQMIRCHQDSCPMAVN